MKRDLVEEEGDLDPIALATKLVNVGYKVAIRSALGACGTKSSSSDCFYNLRNEFLVVSGEGDETGTKFIIEVRFRDHFTIPHPTQRYAHLLDAVPTEVVVAPQRLLELVNLLCSEMSFAFQEQGLSLPPWRQSKSLLSKWLPAKSKDLEVSTPSSFSGSPPTDQEHTVTLTLSRESSGMLTPSCVLQADSPRAVLRGAAAALRVTRSGCPPVKQRSLLSADIAASGGSTPKNTNNSTNKGRSENFAPCAAAVARGGVGGACTTSSSGAVGGNGVRGSSGWVTPPIRRVRMVGARQQ